jgi:hypothetical protein
VITTKRVIEGKGCGGGVEGGGRGGCRAKWRVERSVSTTTPRRRRPRVRRRAWCPGAWGPAAARGVLCPLGEGEAEVRRAARSRVSRAPPFPGAQKKDNPPPPCHPPSPSTLPTLSPMNTKAPPYAPPQQGAHGHHGHGQGHPNQPLIHGQPTWSHSLCSCGTGAGACLYVLSPDVVARL